MKKMVGAKSFIKYSILVILVSSIVINITFVANYYQDIKDRIKLIAKDVLIISNLNPESHLKLEAFNNKPIGYYHYLGNIESLKDIDISNIAQNDKVIKLPNTLIIPPGMYSVNGKLYDCKNEGLYRFIQPLKSNHQRIIYKENLTALLSSISWIASHGTIDDSIFLDKLTSKALRSKLSITCDRISLWAINLLDKVGVKSRKVGALTLEEWNSYDNGHAMIEVYDESTERWKLYDLDNNTYFTHNGRALSLIDFVKYVNTEKYEIINIANDIRMDISGFSHKKGKYDFSLLSESNLFSNPWEPKLRQWYKRVIQVPRVWKDGYTYFTFIDNKMNISQKRERIVSYSDRFRYLEYSDFIKKFY